jgi:putative transposase
VRDGAHRDLMTARSFPRGPINGGAPTPPWPGPAPTAGCGCSPASTHYTAEAWCHVAKVGDRIAALQPVYDAVIDRHGGLDANIARGTSVRHDWGPQYRSHHFGASIAWLGLTDDPAFIGEPETNGCVERFIRTLKEQCLWVELHDTVDDLRVAVSDWTRLYNTEWLIQRHGHLTPQEAYTTATTEVAA